MIRPVDSSDTSCTTASVSPSSLPHKILFCTPFSLPAGFEP